LPNCLIYLSWILKIDELHTTCNIYYTNYQFYILYKLMFFYVLTKDSKAILNPGWFSKKKDNQHLKFELFFVVLNSSALIILLCAVRLQKLLNTTTPQEGYSLARVRYIMLLDHRDITHVLLYKSIFKFINYGKTSL